MTDIEETRLAQRYSRLQKAVHFQTDMLIADCALDRIGRKIQKLVRLLDELSSINAEMAKLTS